MSLVPPCSREPSSRHSRSVDSSEAGPVRLWLPGREALQVGLLVERQLLSVDPAEADRLDGAKIAGKPGFIGGACEPLGRRHGPRPASSLKLKGGSGQPTSEQDQQRGSGSMTASQPSHRRPSG